MSSSATAKVIKYLEEQPNQRAKIATIEIMAGVSQPTIYRMVAKGFLGKVDGMAEVYIKTPIQVKAIEKPIKIKGGYTEADRNLALVNQTAITGKLDYLTQQANRLIELTVAASNNVTTKPAAVASNQQAKVGEKTVEKKDPLAEFKKRAMSIVKNTKGLSWKFIEQKVHAAASTPLDKLVFLMNIEYQFSNNSELLIELDKQLVTLSNDAHGE